MSGGPLVRAVPAALSRAAGEIMASARAAGDVASSVAVADSGDPSVDAALRALSSGWSAQMQVLAMLSASLGITLGASVTEYEQTERSLGQDFDRG